MITPDTRHHIVPGLCQGARLEFRDAMGNAVVTVEDEFSLSIAADLPAGLLRFDLELRSGAFDYETLYCEMTEYPSGEFVRTGPWDLAMDNPPRMQIPTLDVFLDGELYGNLWFEMPDSRDIHARRLGGVFALPFAAAGAHTIRIVVPECERARLNFTMLDSLTIRPDERVIPEVRPKAACRPERPWLFLGGRGVRELCQSRRRAEPRPWQDMEAAVAHYFSTGVNRVRGCPILASAAFMALVDGRESAGFRRLEGLLRSRLERNAFLETHGKFMFIEAGEGLYSEKRRWLMGHGWNDYGFSWILLDYACILQWLGPWLADDLRGWLEQQLLRYGRELYRFIVFQRQYAGAQGNYNAHSNVPMLAVAALGAVLRTAHTEAHDWFRFGVGRIRDSIPLLPRDYTGTHLVWNPPWVLLMVEFLRDTLGECYRGEPFLRELPAVLWRTDALRGPVGFSSLEGFYRLLLAAYCASQLGSEEGQWYYRRLWADCRPADDNPSMAAGFLHVLWHTAAPGREPDAATRDRSVLWPATGFALLQTNYDTPRLAVRFQCGHWSGTPAGCAVDSYAGAGIGDPFPHGGCEVWLHGLPVLRQVADYRMSFRCGNFVTVDGDGFFMGDRWLAGRTDMSRAAFLRRSRMASDICYLDGVNTLSYAPELKLIGSRRQLFFERSLELVILVDNIESRVEHDYALHLHAARIEPVGEGEFRCFSAPVPGGLSGAAEAGPLYVRCLSPHAMRATVTTGSVVLPYPYGVTQVKGGPKLTGDHQGAQPPIDHKIVCAAAGRRTSACFITVLSPQPIDCTQNGTCLRIGTRLGERVVELAESGLTWE